MIGKNDVVSINNEIYHNLLGKVINVYVVDNETLLDVRSHREKGIITIKEQHATYQYRGHAETFVSGILAAYAIAIIYCIATHLH